MKKGKLAAPIVIAALMILWFGSWVAALVLVPDMPFWCKLAGAVIPLALLGVTVYVLAERIKEIRSGEEDDLSQY